jgi:protocatechuate 3,4-dioxygenase, beta subunit
MKEVPMSPSPSRRRLIGCLGVAALAPLLPTPVLAGERPSTPRMTEGPFYPRIFPADSDADLTRVAGRTGRAQGTPLEVSGRVMDRSGRPQAGARVEIWQCDARGQYHHVGAPESSLDPDFQGFGALATDAEGRYRFLTIRPAPYPGRTPHIHFTVAPNERRVLTSQMFFEGEPGNERDSLYRRLGGEARLVTMRLSDAGGVLRGALDIVLA